MNITPTVGRVVYFNPNGMPLSGNFKSPTDGAPLAAIIAAVNGIIHDVHYLNLTVSDVEGRPAGITNIALVQDGETKPEPGTAYAYWMPYQLAQAGIKPLPTLPDQWPPIRSFPHTAEQFPELAVLLAQDFANAPSSRDAQPASNVAGAGGAPKVEGRRIDALVASLTYETAHVPNTTSTVATARLPGGFVAAIGHSGCVAPENFDAELGRKNAIEDAYRKARGQLWQFEGYALYLRLEQVRAAGIGHMPAHQQRVILEQIENRDRLDKLKAFRASPFFTTLDGAEQGRLTRQQDIMQQMDAVLSERINAFPVVSA